MAESGAVRLAAWLYGRCVVVLPRAFRARYEQELCACFVAIASEARGRRGRLAVAGVTVRSILDLWTRAPKQHLAAARAGVLGAGGGWAGAWQEVRHAGRRLARRPAFTVSSVVTLALGIAAATSVFSLVYGVILSPLPYPEADGIVEVDHGAQGLGISHGLGVTYGFYRFYASRVHGAQSMAMYSGSDFTLTGAGDPVRLRGIRTTPSLDDVLRVRPLVGRWLASSDAAPGAPAVVVLSHGLWRDRFGGDPAVVGRSIRVDGTPRVVVGVMPASFAFPDARARFWVPQAVPPSGIGGWNERAVARLAPGATPASFRAELASLLPVLREHNDDPARVDSYLDEARVIPRVVRLKDELVGDVRATLWILLGTVGFVLLIAVANVANLFLVRSEEAQREIALRAALGANRSRLAWGSLAESLLLASAAGALGVGLAAVGVRVLKQRAPVNIPRLATVGLDPAVLAVALAVCLAAALLLGVVPLLRRRRDPGVTLREESHSTAGRRRLRARGVLVAAQVALALVLLIGSGLLVRTFREMRVVDPGFSTRRALTFEIGLPPTRYPTRSDARRFHNALLTRLASLPGVVSAAAVGQCLPLADNMCWGETLEAEGRPTPQGQVPPVTGARVVAGDYFRAMGIGVRGRAFAAADETGPPVAILSEAAAASYFPGEDALGKRIRFGEDLPWRTVVGVAHNVRGRLVSHDFERVIYLPMSETAAAGPPAARLVYVLRAGVPPTSLTPAVRRTVAEMDPAIPVADVRTLADVIARATAPTAFALTLIGLAALMALLLGAVGVYAVVAYSVSRRTSEIGVRMALGANAGDVRRLVVRQGGIVVLAGVALGLAGAGVLTRFMAGMLFGVSPLDPLTYVLLTALMLAGAGLALYLPARRASRVDPMAALREG